MMLTKAIVHRRYLAGQLAPYLIILLVVLGGHAGIFFGESFLLVDNSGTDFWHKAGNSQSEGWVAAEGLGASRFHADPGRSHIWSPWSFWHRLFADQELAHSLNMLVLLAGAALAQYVLIRRIASSLSPIAAALLASLIVFSPLRHKLFFNEHWIGLTIGAPLALLILCEFRTRPAPRHFFLMSLVLFQALVLGSAGAFSHLGVFCGLLAFVLGFSQPDSLTPPSVRARALAVAKMLVLLAVSTLCALLLDAWELYPVFLEKAMVDYVRDPNHLTGGAFASIPPFRELLSFGVSYLHSGWLSPYMLSPGLTDLVQIASYRNVSPFFPVLLLIALHNRQRSQLERACLAVVVAVPMYNVMSMFVPGLHDAIQPRLNLTPFRNFEFASQTFQVGLLACLVATLKDPSARLVVPKYVRWLAAFLGLGYLCVFAFFVSVAAAPGLVERGFEKVAQYLAGYPGIDGLDLALAKALVRQHLAIWDERNVYVQIAFLGLVAGGFVYLAFFSGTLIKRRTALNAAGVLCFLVLSNVMLAFAVYPLNSEPRARDANLNASAAAIPDLRSSRVFHVSVPCLAGMDARHDKSEDGDPEARRVAWKQCVLHRLETTAPRYDGGVRHPRALEMTAIKNFSRREEASWILGILKEEGINIPDMRTLSSPALPLYQSRLFDLAGVKYLYADRQIPQQPSSLRLRFAGQRFFIYENLEAWPQLFLAEQVSFSDNVAEMMRATQRHVFLSPAERSRFDSLARSSTSPYSQGRIRVRSARDGYLQLEIDAQRESLFVWLDAWHPNWVARLNEQAAPVLKVNGIFKGVIIPPGSSQLLLHFETASYKPGIVVSLVFLSVFLGAWIWTRGRGKTGVSPPGAHVR